MSDFVLDLDLELVSGLVWNWSEYFLFTSQNHRTVDSIFSWPICYTFVSWRTWLNFFMDFLVWFFALSIILSFKLRAEQLIFISTFAYLLSVFLLYHHSAFIIKWHSSRANDANFRCRYQHLTSTFFHTLVKIYSIRVTSWFRQGSHTCLWV